MATVLDFTTYDNIRAVLGLEDSEYYTDELLGRTLYQDGLLQDLDRISQDLTERYLEVKAFPTPTPVQERFLRAARVFAAYSVARQLLPSLQFAVPRRESDNKAAADRFSDPLALLKQDIRQGADRAAAALEQALKDLDEDTATFTQPTVLLVSTPDYDPVTGEGG